MYVLINLRKKSIFSQDKRDLHSSLRILYLISKKPFAIYYNMLGLLTVLEESSLFATLNISEIDFQNSLKSMKLE
jgi:hypothetical protein